MVTGELEIESLEWVRGYELGGGELTLDVILQNTALKKFNQLFLIYNAVLYTGEPCYFHPIHKATSLLQLLYSGLNKAVVSHFLIQHNPLGHLVNILHGL